MLAGQDLSTVQTLLIAMVGMSVVFFELAILAIFIFICSKIIGSMKTNAAVANKVAPAVQPTVTAQQPQLQVAVAPAQMSGAGDEAEVAAAIAAALAAYAANSGRRL